MPHLSHRTGRRFLHIFGSTAVALSLTACSAKPDQESSTPTPVKSVRALPADTTHIHELAADIQPRYESSLGFRVPGKIVQRRVNTGDTVRAGTVLARLDTEDLRLAQEAAQAALSQAQAQERLAANEVMRYQALQARDLVAKAELERHESALAVTRAQVKSLQAGLGQAKNTAKYGVLLADSDGVVTAVTAEVGQVVTAGQPVVQLARSDANEAQIFVPEHLVREVRRGQEVAVTLTGQSTPYIGKVREIAAAADPATRTYRVRISLPREADVRLGMSARVRIALPNPLAAGARTTGPNDALVPATSVVGDPGKTYVLVIDQASKAAMREVNMQSIAGAQGRDWVLVSGVQPGVEVIASGAQFVQPGELVAPVKGKGARNE